MIPGNLRRVWPMGTHPKLARTRESVAYHEAGHAVASLVLGLPCHAAKVAGDGAEAVGGFAMSPVADLDAIGTPEIHGPAPGGYHAAMVRLLASARQTSTEAAAIRLAMMSCAGRQAEILFAGLDWPGALWSLDKDGADTREYLLAVDRLEGLGAVQQAVRELLSKEWQQVQVVASRLIESGNWTPEQ